MAKSNLVDILKSLFTDPAKAAEFQANPEKYMADEGIDDVSYEEINEAAVLSFEGPVSQGAVVNTGGASASVGGSTVGSGGGSSAPAAMSHAPAPPPPPPVTMPPAEAAQQTINHYITQVYETTNVDDRDVYQETNNVNNVNAEAGSDVDISNETDTTIASGDGSVAVGEGGSAEGVATGDGAIAAGDDVGAANTGTNSGIIANDSDIDDTIVGDGNTQINDNDGPVAVGDGNVQADDGSQAAGGDLTDNDVSISDSDLDGVNFGEGGTAVQDNSIDVQDNDVTTTVIDNSINDSLNQDNDNTLTVEDSFNTDNSTSLDVDISDSLNTDNSINDSLNQDNDTDVEVTVEDNDVVDFDA